MRAALCFRAALMLFWNGLGCTFVAAALRRDGGRRRRRRKKKSFSFWDRLRRQKIRCDGTKEDTIKDRKNPIFDGKKDKEYVRAWEAFLPHF